MTRRSLAELVGANPRFALLRRNTGQMTRAQRMIVAPKVPTAVQVRYLRLAGQAQDRVQQWARELLGPPADELAPARKDVVGRAFEDAFSELNARLLSLYDGPGYKGALQDIGQGVVAHATKETERTLKIDLRGAEGHLDPYVKEFVRRNVQLIKSVSFDQLGRMREIVDGYQAGQTNQKSLRDQLMETFDLPRARAELIARDQVLKANAQILQQQQTQVGVTEYIWTTAGDERVRGRPGGKWANSSGDHWHLDGTRQSWTAPPVVDPTTGRREHPGGDYQCRCVAVPVVDQLLGR